MATNLVLMKESEEILELSRKLGFTKTLFLGKDFVLVLCFSFLCDSFMDWLCISLIKNHRRLCRPRSRLFLLRVLVCFSRVPCTGRRHTLCCADV